MTKGEGVRLAGGMHQRKSAKERKESKSGNAKGVASPLEWP